jgi:hypothetical protein
MQRTVFFGSRAAVGMTAFMLSLHLPLANLNRSGVCESAGVAFDGDVKSVMNVCCDTLMHIVFDISNVHVIIRHCRKAADKSAPARQASPPRGSSPRRRPTPPRSPPRRLPSPDSEDERSRHRSLQEVRPAHIHFLMLQYAAVLWQLPLADKQTIQVDSRSRLQRCSCC